jgi:macrolide transport system ATP-binding/permease protein
VYEVKELSLRYKVGGQEVEVLKNLNFRVSPGEFVGIQGPSGSGKSTLFYILGFLLRPSSGTVAFGDADIMRLSDEELTVIRNQRIGFIFQQFHLLPKANVLDNILLPTRYPSELASPGAEAREKAMALAGQLGLGAHLAHYPNQLSGGQQQRVAIARALMNDIELILADEPTGNLDSKTAHEVLDLLTELNRGGKTIILITHDPEVARRCSKVYHLKDGAFTRMVENFPPPSAPAAPRAGARARLPAKYDLPVYQRILRSVFPLVTENLLRNKAKSLLTMLGVVIGVAAVLAMVTLGQFTKQKILETYETLGVNKLAIRGYPNWERKATDAVSVSFTAFSWKQDILPLKKIFPEIRFLSPSLSSSRNRATAGGLEAGENKVSAIGVAPEYLAITNRAVEVGNNISPFHVENRSPVCVIGYEIAERLFARTGPLGKSLTITDGRSLNFPCLVIGVLAPVTTNQEWAPPNLHVMLPYTYFQTVNDNWFSSQIHEVTLQVGSEADVEATGKKIKAFFERKYGKAGNFRVDSDSTLVAQMKRFLNIFAVLLTAIALLSLIVGGIGINNMMLVSVAERIKEFGIRKALGATNRSIRVQVLMESVSLCLAAGFMGVALGFGSYELLIFGATKFVPNLKFVWVFEPLAVALSVFSIVAVGIASGFVPALRAEKLQVIEALRTE